MACNTGKTERVLRIIVGAAVVGWGAYTKNWLGAIGLIPLVTGLAGWCPLYAMFGISTTCKTKKKEE